MNARDLHDLAPMSHGIGSRLYDAAGREWLDFVSGFGAVFLGHAHEPTVAALRDQAGRLWACGRLAAEGEAALDRSLRAVLPAGLQPAGLSSSGMEAAEFAIRIAATSTGRPEFVGLEGSMHGKSAMTAAMCWQNAPVPCERLHMLPFVDAIDEAQLLERIAGLLATRPIAALFLEPIQGSNGAHAVTIDFCDRLAALCRERGTLLVVDEILTGLHRTGPPFVSSRMAVPPDLMLFAKNMGNGFPVSAVCRAPHVAMTPAALPGSTFAGNPLAVAVASATLSSMAALPLEDMVGAIERIVREHFAALVDEGIRLRGAGALWCVELDERHDVALVARALRTVGVLATVNARSVRLLPAATMPPASLHDGCERVLDACRAARRRGPRGNR